MTGLANAIFICPVCGERMQTFEQPSLTNDHETELYAECQQLGCSLSEVTLRAGEHDDLTPEQIALYGRVQRRRPDVFHVQWQYIDTPKWVKAFNMWVAHTNDETEALVQTRQHAAERRPGVDITIMSVERWRIVPDMIGVEVSTLKRVRLTHKGMGRFVPTNTLNERGEVIVSLFIGGHFETHTLDSLISRTFPKE